jgi:hypothetical protein
MPSVLLKVLAVVFSISIVTAFTTPATHFGVSSRVSTFRPILSGDEPGEAASPLAEVADGKDASPEIASAVLESNDSSIVANLGKGGEVTEVKWVDPAMGANTNPFQISPWAVLLGGFPFILLANDIFHFIPESMKDGPLGFIL